MDQNNKSKNKHMHMWPINLQLKSQEYTMEKWTVLSINGAGKTGEPKKKE